MLLTVYYVRCENMALQLAARSYIHETSNDSRTNSYPARNENCKYAGFIA
ncbi:hypothetical protein GCM10010913_15150 [Paenibacillus aceti]|uniref:Uncharacterized protein n=1 Tax=Paenibacillus aceti TaxID=1820010 RepID=A0ABQ1VSH1_9BACL|nr:hypothetical protein GCM10010913_15150 [Paenibacillus aceti]